MINIGLVHKIKCIIAAFVSFCKTAIPLKSHSHWGYILRSKLFCFMYEKLGLTKKVLI